jgi:hypothetical protein
VRETGLDATLTSARVGGVEMYIGQYFPSLQESGV